MNPTIQIDFRGKTGERLAGELVNPYRVVESMSSRCGVGIEIDQLADDEIDVLVFFGGEMQAHRVKVSRIICADKVLV